MAPFIDSSLLLLSLPGLFSANPGGRANVPKVFSHIFVFKAHLEAAVTFCHFPLDAAFSTGSFCSIIDLTQY